MAHRQVRPRLTPSRWLGRAGACGVALLTAGAALTTPAHADNKRLNDSVVVNVRTIQYQAGCPTEVDPDPALQAAAQRHAVDVLNNPTLGGDVGTDLSTPQQRAEDAGYRGRARETVAVNPALAINGVEILNQWYHDAAAFAIMSDCANTRIGVWSENSLARTVVVAVYGSPT